MGPYSEEKQYKRAASIQRLVDNKSLSEDVRQLWRQKLIGLALTEDEYNRRVLEIYNSPSFKKMTIDYLGGIDDV